MGRCIPIVRLLHEVNTSSRFPYGMRLRPTTRPGIRSKSWTSWLVPAQCYSEGSSKLPVVETWMAHPENSVAGTDRAAGVSPSPGLSSPCLPPPAAEAWLNLLCQGQLFLGWVLLGTQWRWLGLWVCGLHVLMGCGAGVNVGGGGVTQLAPALSRAGWEHGQYCSVTTQNTFYLLIQHSNVYYSLKKLFTKYPLKQGPEIVCCAS